MSISGVMLVTGRNGCQVSGAVKAGKLSKLKQYLEVIGLSDLINWDASV